jgi:putative transposase
MGRMPRIYIEGALLYLTSRGDHNQDIFRDSEDYAAYLALIKRYKQQYDFKLFSFVLLPNHIHLLIEPKLQTSVSDIMHDLNSNYTKYFNGRYNRKGHLFQERYKMKLLEKGQYLLTATAHIHLNPVPLALADNIEGYKYSSYPLYAGKTDITETGGHKIDLKEEMAEIFSSLSAPGTGNAGGYAAYLNTLSLQEKSVFTKKLAKGHVLGSPAFKEKVKQEEARLMANRQQVPGAELRRKIIMASGVLVLALAVITLFLYVRNVRLKQSFDIELKEQDARAKELIRKEKEEVFRDLDEKYRADMVSFEAATRRLELERKRTKELEDKLESRVITD